ncbi:tetratricopeptide repeat protein [Catalinimonas niigatensis]|uniref:tetratricopeptide repeat protein n=1 Tax=Catalinimonas niigatensis TaxID=1397264 RepID=UPI002665220D|nr:tetratricopeptide repeat protein [Catalinimonas niigatensis]WPP51181.1 hypothetical protein PZB72_02100 [Catalinimonas niigatensis]
MGAFIKILIGILILFTCTLADAQDDILLSMQSNFKAKNYRKVIDATKSYLKKHQPHDTVQLQLMHLKSRSYRMLQQYDSSFYTYIEIIKKYPTDRVTLVHLGYLFGEAGNYHSAFHFLQKLRKYHPTDPVGTLNFSFYHNELGNHETAIAYADSTLQIARDSLTIGSAWNNRCYANIQLGNLTVANEELEVSLSYFPNNSYAYRNLALINIGKRKDEEACAALEIASQLGGIHITQQLKRDFCGK